MSHPRGGRHFGCHQRAAGSNFQPAATLLPTLRVAMGSSLRALLSGVLLLGLMHTAAAQTAYQTVLSGLTSDLSSYFSPSYTTSAPATLGSLLGDYTTTDPTTEFCAPAGLVPAEVTPAVLLGPTMTITLTTGSCAVAKDLNGTGALVVTCDPPTITWVKARADQLLTGFDTPITYVKPFTSGAVFTEKECVIGKNLTTGSSEVLWGGGDPTTYASPSSWLQSYQSGAYTFGMMTVPATTVAAEPLVVPAAVAPIASSAAAAAAAGMTAAGAAGR